LEQHTGQLLCLPVGLKHDGEFGNGCLSILPGAVGEVAVGVDEEIEPIRCLLEHSVVLKCCA
jgi:hypothetical protein